MAKAKAMVLVFGFNLHFLSNSKEKVVLLSGKVVLAFGFNFCPREGAAVPLPLLTSVGRALFVDQPELIRKRQKTRKSSVQEVIRVR